MTARTAVDARPDGFEPSTCHIASGPLYPLNYGRPRMPPSLSDPLASNARNSCKTATNACKVVDVNTYIYYDAQTSLVGGLSLGPANFLKEPAKAGSFVPTLN